MSHRRRLAYIEKTRPMACDESPGVGAKAVEPVDPDSELAEKTPMTYEEFRAAFMAALRRSKLEMIGLWPDEEINLRTTDRRFEVHVEPLGGSDAEPFHVSATVSWRWDALLTARAATTEDDMLTELFSRSEAVDMDAALPRVRIDLKLHASLPWGKPLPMPSRSAWSSWARETMGRLEHIDPLTPGDRRTAAW